MNKKTKILNWSRPTIQWIVIVAIIFIAFTPRFNENFTPDFEAYCPFGGIQSLGSYLLNQALSCTMTSAQIVMGVVLILGVFVFSKLFCSFICPVGTFSEWLGLRGEKRKIRYTIKGAPDKVLRSLKYILLFATLYFTLQTNELFCKKFDPYYAIATGFSADVETFYAIIAIALVIIGSIFIRLFWCKYICPFGALSNIFKFTGFFLAILVVYILLLKAGFEISYVWPLAIACAGGYTIEITGLFGKFFPLVKITRNENTCTNCQLCSRKCPQAIDVANLKVVREPDCNLCGECINVCPEQETIQINKRKNLRWLPAAATIGLVLTGFLLGSFWEIPTIDERWSDSESIAKAETYSQSGLKNIKCYGSSMALATKLKNIDGIVGVATFVKEHKVKIYYDENKISKTEVQETLFTPSEVLLRVLSEDESEIMEVKVWLNNFFDQSDFNYLSRMLQDKTEAIFVSSEFDCPVLVSIYFPGNAKIDKGKLIKILESKKFSYQLNENNQTVDLGFTVAKGPEYNKMTTAEFITKFFDPYEAEFNNYEQYSSSVIGVYQIPFGKNRIVRNKVNFLVSHLSNEPGVVKFRIFLNDSLEETIAISYVDTITNTERILEKLNTDTLQITYTSGAEDKIKNMFEFGKN